MGGLNGSLIEEYNHLLCVYNGDKRNTSSISETVIEKIFQNLQPFTTNPLKGCYIEKMYQICESNRLLGILENNNNNFKNYNPDNNSVVQYISEHVIDYEKNRKVVVHKFSCIIYDLLTPFFSFLHYVKNRNTMYYYSNHLKDVLLSEQMIEEVDRMYNKVDKIMKPLRDTYWD